MRFLSALSLLAVLVVAGCDRGETTVTVRETVTETTNGTVPNEAPAVLTLFFLRDGKVAPVSRAVVSGADLTQMALDELLKGPSADDEGVQTAIPAGTTAGAMEVADDTLVVGLTPEPTDRAARAEIVYTLTALPNVKRVSFGGTPGVGRRAFENQTPSILVLSPLPGESVESGFTASGTANTFEATFDYELKDSTGKVLRKNFVTATSGTGTRGTFEFKVSYKVDEPQDGKLVVFEISQADGSRINESEIPLRLE